MTILYLDELFAVNALSDYLLLRSVAALRSLPRRRRRCLLAALFGGLYAAGVWLPALAPFAAPAAAVAVSGLMVLLAFGGEAGLFRSWGCFLLLSAAYAGAVGFGCRLSAPESPLPLPLRCTPRILFFSFGVCYALVSLLLRRGEERRERQKLTAVLTLRGKTAVFPVLRDTGNSLRSPLSGEHVLIAERAALAPLFPLPLPERGTEIFSYLSSLEPSPGCQLLPYRSVGGEGLLCCFRPDCVTVDGHRRELLVGVAEGALSPDGEYRGIV